MPRLSQLQGTSARTDQWNADIIAGESIRIFGNSGPKSYDLTFKIGDEAVYNTYNLVYTGTIVGIGPKTVTIESYGERYRLKISLFVVFNWNYDARRIAERNNDTMYRI